MKSKSVHKLLSAILVFAMVMAMLPLGVFAAEEEAVTLWDFRLDEYTGQESYDGLTLSGSFNKHGAQYGLQIKNATVTVPVPGACEVQVAVGYNWDITFPDGTNYFDNTNSGDITLSYVHEGEAGNVNITVGGQCTSYIKYIEIVPKAEPVPFWDFRAAE